jgi:hypothetical protein
MCLILDSTVSSVAFPKSPASPSGSVAKNGRIVLYDALHLKMAHESKTAGRK